ncbi:MAG: hypothetical protein WDW38_000345 [Sanguina aurantia]
MCCRGEAACTLPQHGGVASRRTRHANPAKPGQRPPLPSRPSIPAACAMTLCGYLLAAIPSKVTLHPSLLPVPTLPKGCPPATGPPSNQTRHQPPQCSRCSRLIAAWMPALTPTSASPTPVNNVTHLACDQPPSLCDLKRSAAHVAQGCCGPCVAAQHMCTPL